MLGLNKKKKKGRAFLDRKKVTSLTGTLDLNYAIGKLAHHLPIIANCLHSQCTSFLKRKVFCNLYLGDNYNFTGPYSSDTPGKSPSQRTG